MKIFLTSLLKNLLLSISILSLCWVGSAWATSMVPVYIDEAGEGYFDETPVSPIAGNPADTLGGQRRYVFEHGLKLLNRVVWLPNALEFPMKAFIGDYGPNFVGSGGPTFYPDIDATEYGLRSDVDYPNPSLVLLTDGESWVNFEEWEKAFGTIGLTNASRFSRSINFTEGDWWSYLPVILHEGLHVLGMTSSVGSIGEEWGPDLKYTFKQSPYDAFIRHLGAEVELLADMSEEQQIAVYRGGDDVVFVGEQSNAHSALVMNGEGYDPMGNVILYALNEGDPDESFISQPVSHVDMHNHPEKEENLMAPTGGNTLELGIVAYMFSDMGYGPVVDSVVTSPDTNINTLSIHTQAIVSDLVDIPNDRVEHMVVTILLPQGLSFGAFSDDPAVCVVDGANALKAVCTYADLLTNTASMIDVALVGEDGAYTVELDVEHQQRHVDGVPVNNFFSAAVLMGSNPLSSLALSAPTVEADTGSDAVIGSLSVENSSDDGVTYSLVNGGSEGLFILSGSDVVVTQALSASNNGTYSLSVQATTDLGFVLENTFEVAVSINPMTGVSISGATVSANKSAGATVGTLAADHALGADVTFTLVDGAGDNADFDIDGDTIITRGSLARSDNGTYSLSVVASDGAYSVESTVSVTVSIAAVVVPAPPSSGGGGCTVGQPGNSDSSFPMILLGMALLMLRRRAGLGQ